MNGRWLVIWIKKKDGWTMDDYYSRGAQDDPHHLLLSVSPLTVCMESRLPASSAIRAEGPPQSVQQGNKGKVEHLEQRGKLWARMQRCERMHMLNFILKLWIVQLQIITKGIRNIMVGKLHRIGREMRWPDDGWIELKLETAHNKSGN